MANDDKQPEKPKKPKKPNEPPPVRVPNEDTVPRKIEVPPQTVKA